LVEWVGYPGRLTYEGADALLPDQILAPFQSIESGPDGGTADLEFFSELVLGWQLGTWRVAPTRYAIDQHSLDLFGQGHVVDRNIGS